MIVPDDLIVEASKVTEEVDGANASETKEATEINDEFCPDSDFLLDKEERNKVTFTFNSDYGEEDILDSFKEIFPGIIAELASRVRVAPLGPLSADHLCKVVLYQVQGTETFSWPAMDPVNTEVFRNIRRIMK